MDQASWSLDLYMLVEVWMNVPEHLKPGVAVAVH
jgi:hypothetical protein